MILWTVFSIAWAYEGQAYALLVLALYTPWMLILFYIFEPNLLAPSVKAE